MKLIAAACLFFAAGLSAQPPKSENAQSFDCYVQASEVRMEQRQAFLRSDTDATLRDQLVRGQKIRTFEANGPNPHKVTGGQLYDLVGAVFIPGTTLTRLIAMLQDYDHRERYFPETISSSKLLCVTGADRFQYTMRMKEPAVMDITSDVVWEKVSPERWRCRSVSSKVTESGKEHGYVRRLNSYWRFVAAEKGVLVESETITLSDEFGSVTRMLGAAVGISPEKSLRHSLGSMRESVLKPDFEMPKPPAGVPACGELPPSAGCPAGSGHSQ